MNLSEILCVDKELHFNKYNEFIGEFMSLL